MKIIDISIEDDRLGEGITVCALQLPSPFFEDVKPIQGAEYPFLGWTTEGFNKRSQQLKNCLAHVEKLSRLPHFLIFPEYSLHEGMIHLIEDFSSKNSINVIASYYNQTNRRLHNILVISDNKGLRTFGSFKMEPSRYDQNYLSKLDDDDKFIIRFKWKANKDNGSMEITSVILSCYDFLLWPHLPQEAKNADIIFVPLSTPSIEQFTSMSDIIIRTKDSAPEHRKSRIIILCNGTDTPTTINGIGICGGTQFISNLDKERVILEMNCIGGLIADLNPLYIPSLPSQISAGIKNVISSESRFSLDPSWRITWDQYKPSIKLKQEINPNGYSRLGLTRYYAFSKLKNYITHIPKLRQLPIACHGIYGFHDLFFHGAEESVEVFVSRLNHYIRDKIGPDIEINVRDFLKVKHVIKFRGQIVANENKEGLYFYTPKGPDNISPNEINQIIPSLSLWASGNDLDKEIENKLISDAFLLPVQEGSDLTAKDKELDKNEFLIFVFLTGRTFEENAIKYFERTIIRDILLHDERVRTIEVCEQVYHVQPNIIPANYILHIVGSLRAVNEIVIELIHKRLASAGIDYGTRVIPVVETIKGSTYVALTETRLGDSWKIDRWVELTHANRNESDPFVIKKVQEDMITIILTIWHKGLLWTRYLRERGEPEENVRDMESTLASCLYSISVGLVQSIDPLPSEMRGTIWHRCGDFYRRLSSAIEESIEPLYQSIKVSFGDQFANKMATAWNKHTGEIYQEKDHLVAGELLQRIIYWNIEAKKDDHIGDEGFNDKLKNLQRLGFAEFRGLLMHNLTKAKESDESHIKIKKDLKKFVRSIDAGLDLILLMLAE